MSSSVLRFFSGLRKWTRTMKGRAALPVQTRTTPSSAAHLAFIKMQTRRTPKLSRRSTRPTWHTLTMLSLQTLLSITSALLLLTAVPSARTDSLFFSIFRSKRNPKRSSIPHSSRFLEQLHILAVRRSYLYLQQSPFFPLFSQVPTSF